MKRFLLTFALLIPVLVHAQAWSGIITSTRAMDWSHAGVVGGIPTTYTKCGSTVTAGTSIATVNTLIAACGANTYLEFGAGRFVFTDSVSIQDKNNFFIKGQGANSTFFVFSAVDGCWGTTGAICVAPSNLNWSGGPNNTANWTAGYAQGATTITLSSVTNLKVGNPLILDQIDNSCVSGCPGTTDTGSVYISADPNLPAPTAIQGASGSARSLRDQSQIVTVASCDGNSTPGHACSSGTNITITPGLYMPNWNSANTPGAWWATIPMSYVGVENLSIDASGVSGSDQNIVFLNVANNWASGVKSYDSANAHVLEYYSNHFTIRDSYFFLTQNSLSQSYGFECFDASDGLVENNIFQAIAGPMTLNGPCEGTVLSYNYGVNDYYAGTDFFTPYSTVHEVGADMVLYEGNEGPLLNEDNFHGTHNFVTYFRNYSPGPQPFCPMADSQPYATATFSSNCSHQTSSSLQLMALSRFVNVIGNVWGWSGVQTNYKNAYGSGTTSDPAIYVFGYGQSFGGITIPNDGLVNTTAMLWGNYDTVNAATQWNSSEVPSGLSGVNAAYANPVPGSMTLPNSFHYSLKPSWWPALIAWPPIGPDISSGTQGRCSGGTQAGSLALSIGQCPGGIVTANINGGHVNANPAEVCFLNTMMAQASGLDRSPLAFDASTCYGTIAPPPVSSFSPTSLSFGSVPQSSHSIVMTSTFTNVSGVSLTLGSTTFTGTNSSDFTTSANTCTGTLTNTSTCVVSLVFTPTASIGSSETGLLSLAYTGASGSPATVALSGVSGSPAPAPIGLCSGACLIAAATPAQCPPPTATGTIWCFTNQIGQVSVDGKPYEQFYPLAPNVQSVTINGVTKNPMAPNFTLYGKVPSTGKYVNIFAQ